MDPRRDLMPKKYIIKNSGLIYPENDRYLVRVASYPSWSFDKEYELEAYWGPLSEAKVFNSLSRARETALGVGYWYHNVEEVN